MLMQNEEGWEGGGGGGGCGWDKQDVLWECESSEYHWFTSIRYQGQGTDFHTCI